MIIHRRLAFGLVAAAAVPVALRAQPQPSGASTSATPNAATPPANLQGMDADRLRTLTHEAGTFSLMTARIGAEKARHPDAKRFAQFEVIEQEGIAESMRLAGHQMQQPNFSGEKREMMNRLQQAQAGDEFDRMFLQGQHDGHQELLNLTSAMMAAQNAPAPDKIIATLANGQIREHLILISTMLGMAQSPTAQQMPRGNAMGSSTAEQNRR
ncbi:DUF4142 domain-containing protein [Roseomonas sp. CCTCC AB2023176]|uniref:DUF4142 domain-containing protein n=1 Tax=Roseomonas sp. CCTCC AB2023176 TaxID=3342640 RepID=UPI0035DC9736